MLLPLGGHVADIGAALWKRISDGDAETLRKLSTVETMVNGNVDDLVIKLEPARK